MSTLSYQFPGKLVERRAPWRAWNIAERTFAGVALAGLSPLLLSMGTAVALLSGRSPLIAHRRIGQDGRPFWMLKFRTMWPARTERGPLSLIERVTSDALPEPKTADDARVTSRLARLMRRHSLDELPQLAHVVTGTMSLVGPRPLIQPEIETYYGPDASEVLSVRPGLTGLWQVAGRSSLTYHQRRELDLKLVRRRSIKLHLEILSRTIPQVLTGRNSW